MASNVPVNVDLFGCLSLAISIPSHPGDMEDVPTMVASVA
jgi:hypothetical protein